MDGDTLSEGLQVSAPAKSNRREQVRVDAEFQNRFRALLLGFALLILLFAAGLSLSVSYFITNPGLLPISAWIPAAVGIISLGGCFFIYKLCDRISHRYCGPTIPILRTLDAIRRGERPPPIRLRTHDEYHGVATALNQTLQSLGAMDPPAEGPVTGVES